jgi:hypothetical protein
MRSQPAGGLDGLTPEQLAEAEALLLTEEAGGEEEQQDEEQVQQAQASGQTKQLSPAQLSRQKSLPGGDDWAALASLNITSELNLSVLQPAMDSSGGEEAGEEEGEQSRGCGCTWPGLACCAVALLC